MKHRFIIDCESDGFLAQVNVVGEIAGIMAIAELGLVRVTRLHVTSIDEPQGELIDAAQCDCVKEG